ncbi:MAG: RluA family pseudouridine synthase [Candidatus Buchananbacteria bacterium]|nr:RluA family pseudouridine synthase [Candidatus Buchananbacteria bacterium]
MLEKIIITNENENQRLDKFLTEKLHEDSRSRIKKMIKQGLVLINNKPAKVHQFLKVNDEITVLPDAETKAETSVTQQSATTLEPKIIFEDNNFLVLDKPDGLLVHPTDLNEPGTLVEWVHQKYPEIETVGEYKYRGGIIHRLDKDVSGVIVIAKNDQTFYHLKEQFKQRQVKKIYYALVYGHPTQPEGEINLPIGRNKDGQFVAHPRRGTEKFNSKDKVAKTKYKVLEYIKDYTLLEVQILTGRTHQIRAHLSAIGHPIIGDQIYKPKKNFLHFFQHKVKVINPGRIFLHSAQIGFNDFDNHWVEFNSPLPEKLTAFLHEQKNK